MGSQKSLVEGRKYHLIASSVAQAWNNGICVLNSIENNRALVTKLEGANQHTKFNVPISDLHEIVKFICIKERGEHKLGDIMETAMFYYELYNKEFPEYYVPLAEFREERINQILE